MTGRIVVGITDSDAGRRALEWAADRASAGKRTLHLVSVVGGAVGVVGEGAVMGAAMDAASEYLESEAQRLRNDGLQVDVEVRRGNPVTHLAAASDGAELLVIGSDYTTGARGRRGMHGVRIVSAAHCPAIVIPPTDAADRSGVVVGVDGSPISEHTLAFAAAEADRTGEALSVVSVWTPVEVPNFPMLDNTEYLEGMQSATEEMQAIAVAGIATDYPDLIVNREVLCGYPSHLISERASRASLAVVGSHGRGAFARFLLGSISEEVLISLTSPTAVIR